MPASRATVRVLRAAPPSGPTPVIDRRQRRPVARRTTRASAVLPRLAPVDVVGPLGVESTTCVAALERARRLRTRAAERPIGRACARAPSEARRAFNRRCAACRLGLDDGKASALDSSIGHGIDRACVIEAHVGDAPLRRRPRASAMASHGRALSRVGPARASRQRAAARGADAVRRGFGSVIGRRARRARRCGRPAVITPPTTPVRVA